MYRVGQRNNKIHISTIVWTLVWITNILIFSLVYWYLHSDNSEWRGQYDNLSIQTVEIKECPDGSYNIGIEKNNEVICKLEPTGCPYGDSIPLDSPKCIAPEIDARVEVQTIGDQNGK